MITLKQIAQECNVSIATVSKALNNATDIGEVTANRIKETARRLGYHPNAAARTLKTNRSYSIGVLYEDSTGSGLTHEYFTGILDALKNEIEESGYTLTFISRNIGGKKTSYLENCQYRNCDGVIVASVDFTNPQIRELVDSGIPVVTIDYSYDNCSSVLSDNFRSMWELTEYVYQLGHRRIAMIHGEDTAVSRLRKAAFHRFCMDMELHIPDEYILEGQFHEPKLSGLATRKLLALEEPPTCILYPDDISILGGLTEIEKHGLRVPEDISVVGYDGIRLSRILRPILTTLEQDSDALGRVAAQELLKRLADPQSFTPRIITIPGRIQTGETVKEHHQ